MTTRRHFLNTSAAAIASLILPRSLFARETERSSHFIHADFGNFWPVADPVVWSLQNARQPILERAGDGLAKLTHNDAGRIIRLVTRRCRLSLLELHPGQVVVHHWGTHQADLRHFFKSHRLAHQGIEVVLIDRKKEITTTKAGDDFLYGSRIAPDFPLDLFRQKWASRFVEEADDWSAAPGTRSGYAWEGVEDGCIPWAAMKSAWRRSAPIICQNCNTPTLLVNFGYPWTGMLNRSAMYIHVCGTCRRSFRDMSVKDVPGWMASNLDEEARPDAEMVWERRVKRTTS